MDGRCARVRVPASTANLGPGFDTLGMALDLYAEIEMKVSEKTTVRLSGPHLEGVPTDKSNLVYKVAQLVFDQAGVSIPELEISMSSEIPLARGLGSSAAKWLILRITQYESKRLPIGTIIWRLWQTERFEP